MSARVVAVYVVKSKAAKLTAKCRLLCRWANLRQAVTCPPNSTVDNINGRVSINNCAIAPHSLNIGLRLHPTSIYCSENRSGRYREWRFSHAGWSSRSLRRARKSSLYTIMHFYPSSSLTSKDRLELIKNQHQKLPHLCLRYRSKRQDCFRIVAYENFVRQSPNGAKAIRVLYSYRDLFTL